MNTNAPNKSLDRSGGSVFLNMNGAARLIEFAPPGQLRRSVAYFKGRMMKQNLWRLSLLSFILLATNSSEGQSLKTNGKSGISVNIAQSSSFESVLSRVRLLDSVSYRIGWTLEPGEFHRLSQEALKYGTVDDFKALLKDENPIVRVMALICLASSVDAEKFAVMAQTLFVDDARVKYTNGCVLNQSGTVGSIATQLAENRFFLTEDDKRRVR